MTARPEVLNRWRTLDLPSCEDVQFVPTGLMIRTLCAYLEALPEDNEITPVKVIEVLGNNKSNWYKWQERAEFNE